MTVESELYSSFSTSRSVGNSFIQSSATGDGGDAAEHG